MRTTLNQEEIAKFAAEIKYSFIGVMDDEGYPHVNLIGSLEAKNDHELMFGKTYYGKIKNLMQEKKKCAFILASLTREYWRGRLNYTGRTASGDDMLYYNEKPKNRYNAYYPVNEVYYFDLLDVDYGPLAFPTYIAAAQKAGAVAAGFVNINGETPIFGQGQEIIQRQDCIKFLAYEGPDGYPRFIPLIHALPIGPNRFIFAEDPHPADIQAIPAGAKVTIHCISMFTMEAVQYRGIYQGLQDGIGVVDVKVAYNPMIPRPGIIYPSKPYARITEF